MKKRLISVLLILVLTLCTTVNAIFNPICHVPIFTITKKGFTLIKSNISLEVNLGKSNSSSNEIVNEKGAVFIKNFGELYPEYEFFIDNKESLDELTKTLFCSDKISINNYYSRYLKGPDFNGFLKISLNDLPHIPYSISYLSYSGDTNILTVGVSSKYDSCFTYINYHFSENFKSIESVGVCYVGNIYK